MGTPYYAGSLEELPSYETLRDMTGLEFIDAICNGRLPAPPIGRTLNYAIHDVAEGRVVFRGTPTFDSFNPLGTLHGGWYGTVLDSCMACAIQTRLPKAVGYTTLEYKINILRTIPQGITVDAIGEVDHVGRQTGIANGRIVGVEDGKLYATGSTTCIILPLPKG